MDKRLEGRIAKHLDRFDWGKNQINRIIAPLTFAISIFTLLKVYNISLTIELMMLCSAAMFVIIYTIGFYWDKSGLIDKEIAYQNKHNEFVRLMLRRKKF